MHFFTSKEADSLQCTQNAKKESPPLRAQDLTSHCHSAFLALNCYKHYKEIRSSCKSLKPRNGRKAALLVELGVGAIEERACPSSVPSPHCLLIEIVYQCSAPGQAGRTFQQMSIIIMAHVSWVNKRNSLRQIKHPLKRGCNQRNCWLLGHVQAPCSSLGSSHKGPPKPRRTCVRECVACADGEKPVCLWRGR